VARLVGASAVAACGDDESGSGGSGGKKISNLKVMLDWTPSPQQAGIHWADAKGLFKAQGLSVKIQAPSDVTAPAKFVATNRVDLSVYYQPDLMLAKAQGLPLKAVGTIMERPLASVAYEPGATSTSVESLKGKKVASFSLPMNKAMADTIFAQAGMKRSDVQWQELGFNAATALRAKRVAATVGGFWTSKPEVPGATYVPVDKLGVPTYDEMIVVANSDRLADDPAYDDAVKRFLKAMDEGTAASLKAPDELYDIMKPRTKALSTLRDFTNLAVEGMTPPSGRKLGCLDPKSWDTFTAWMVQHKLLKTAIPTADVVSTKYGPNCSS
jgi:putative hydroxymethylpyrimidine transport system substrate-binding protein